MYSMSQMEKSNEYYAFEQKCQNLLKESEIRFAGLISPMGHLVAGGMKKDLKPLEDDADMRKLYMELILRVSTRQEFDQTLGVVNYSASRREKAVVLSFPTQTIKMPAGRTSNLTAGVCRPAICERSCDQAIQHRSRALRLSISITEPRPM